MPVVIDELITRYRLDASQYKREAASVTAATRSNQSAFASAGKAWGPLRAGAMVVGSAVAGVVAALAAFTAGTAGFMVAAGRKAAEFDALVKALEAVEGSATAAKDAMKSLMDIAKAPGAGPEDAVRGFLLMRQSGLSRAFAELAIREFANANARVGGGGNELLGLLRVAAQIAAKPHLQGEELLQFMERSLPVHGLLKERFGTSDTEELKKRGVTGTQALEAIVDGLSKTARAGESAKNSIENFGIAMDQAMVQIGTGFNTALVPMVQEFTKAVEDLGESGVLADFGTFVADLASDMAEVMGGGLELKDALIEVGAVLLDAADATRNFFTNVKEFVDWWLKTVPLGWAVRSAGARLGGSGEAFREMARLREAQREAEKRRDERRQRREEEGLPETASPAEEAARVQTQILKEIERNTARSVDLQRAALGGGDLGAFGVTPVALGAMRRKGAGRDGARLVALGIGMITADMRRSMAAGPMAR